MNGFEFGLILVAIIVGLPLAGALIRRYELRRDRRRQIRQRLTVIKSERRER